MLSVRFTRSIQRFQPWARFKSSSTAAKIEIDVDGKKLKTKTKTNALETSSDEKVSGQLSKDLFAKLVMTNSADIAMETKKTTSKRHRASLQDLVQLIDKADTLNELLAIAIEPKIDRIHALKIVSRLAEWSSAGKVKPSDFENNPQFIRVCSLLTTAGETEISKKQPVAASPSMKSKELELILNVAGEAESSKLIHGLQLPQMVKVLSALAQQRARSLSLLRQLSYSISSHKHKLNLKECSDIFYASTVLNFHDALLLTRASMDTIAILENENSINIKAAPIGSIIKSIGFLKFKETDLLNSLAKWTLEHKELFRPRDLASLCETLAIVNHLPLNVDDLKEKLLPSISREDFSAAEWLDHVWSLSALELVDQSHLKSVLSSTFIGSLAAELGPGLNATIKKKLLNINAVAKTIVTDYNGPFLKPEGSVYEIDFGYPKSKQTLVAGLLDTLTKLFTDQSLVKKNVDTRMGFVIDAVCVLDKNQTPVKNASSRDDAFRIAFVVLDFHDLCQNTVNEPNGISSLAIKLLKKQGYTVLVVPHTEFNTSETIIKRVQYLDARLKNIVSGNV